MTGKKVVWSITFLELNLLAYNTFTNFLSKLHNHFIEKLRSKNFQNWCFFIPDPTFRIMRKKSSESDLTKTFSTNPITKQNIILSNGLFDLKINTNSNVITLNRKGQRIRFSLDIRCYYKNDTSALSPGKYISTLYKLPSTLSKSVKYEIVNGSIVKEI